MEMLLSFHGGKSKMYSHIIGVDDEIWDIIEDGVDFPFDLEGMAVDMKSLTEAQWCWNKMGFVFASEVLMITKS